MGQPIRSIALGGEERILSEALVVTYASCARLLVEVKSKTEAAMWKGGDVLFC
jgi:hypothetical protein